MSSTTPSNNNNASAPEVLLALAKDVRYIQLCQSLLEDVLNWKNNHDMTLCVASILYATTVVLRTGRTLGMEACGLSFRGNNDNGTGTATATSGGASLTTLAQKYKRWHSWSAFVLSALWMHAMKRWATTTSSSNHNNNTSNLQNWRIPRPVGTNNHASERNNHNDGWFSHRHAQAQNNNNNRTTTLSNFSTSTTWLSAEDRDSSEEERLRGDARRRFHQQQRQAMLDRAAQATTHPEQSTPPERRPTNATTNSQPQPYQMLFPQRWRQKLKDQVKSLIQALSVPRGPHVIADPNYNEDTYETTLWMWLIKLHLAWFVMNSGGGGGESSKYGQYPTWMHRLWKLSMISNGDGPSRVAERPASVRVVGLLIFVQGTATLVRTLTIRTVEFWMKRQQQSRLQRRRIGEQQPQPYRPSTFLGQLFGRSTLLPSPSSSSSPEIPRVLHAQVVDEDEEEEEEDGDEVTSVMTTRTSNNMTATSSSSVVTCGICSNHRTFPAASVTCGHVFCWKCLYHWVSSVRPECPLCRSSCRPQDLMALHHYTPVAPTEHS